MSSDMTRRNFVKSTITAAAAATIAGAYRGARAQSASPALRIRRNAQELPANDDAFKNYADAVKAMHALPANDPRHWRRQAIIHADFCAHGTQNFLPWHRHYINLFEKICSQIIGVPNFAIPYWDWTDKNCIIPDPLFDMHDLNVASWSDDGHYSSANWPNINTTNIRAIDKGVGLQSDANNGNNFTSDTINSILGMSTYELFRTRLEGEPHNTAHVLVGFAATETGHMGSGLSPLDPLFWLHHCNIDRLWAQWQLAGNVTPDSSDSYDGNFVDAAGQPATGLTANNARDFQSLGYSYEQFASPGEVLAAANALSGNEHPSLAALLQSASPLQPTITSLGNVTSIAPMAIGVPASVPTPVSGLQQAVASFGTVRDVNLPSVAAWSSNSSRQDMLAEFGKTKTTPRRILARLKRVQTTASVDPLVNVFINCPYLTAETGARDPHYAGTFAFFGAANRAAGQHSDADHQHDHTQAEFVIDLTKAVRNSNLQDVSTIKVQFVPRSPNQQHPAEGDVRIGEIELISV